MTKRSATYKFTIENKDDPRLAELKAEIAAYNKVVRAEIRSGNAQAKSWDNNSRFPMQMSLLRVKLEARGPRAEHAENDYPQYDERFRRRAYDTSLPHKYANHYDVYVHEDMHNTLQLKREIDTGLTPGQLAMITREETKMFQAKMEMMQRLGEAGISVSGTADGTEYMSKEKRREELEARGLSQHFINRIV